MHASYVLQGNVYGFVYIYKVSTCIWDMCMYKREVNVHVYVYGEKGKGHCYITT